MSQFLAAYVHHLDPFAIQLTDSFGIRWYGLAYVAGFLGAYLLLRWFVSLRVSELGKTQVADFITICAIVGVMLGGRLGYMLLYDFQSFAQNPLIFFNFLGGGMASHGGVIGVMVATLLFARFTKKSWTGLGDNLVVAAPIGIFFGRLANFINGELYGRITTSRWGMKFPDELYTHDPTPLGYVPRYSLEQLRELAGSASTTAPELAPQVEAYIQSVGQTTNPHNGVVGMIIEASRAHAPFREQLGEILNLRHASQLYEGLVEGLLLFLILLAVRLKWKQLYHGILTGLFFILYAIGRIFVENFREPDSEMILGMTKGQFYSLFMILIGLAFIIWAMISKRTTRIPQSQEASA